MQINRTYSINITLNILFIKFSVKTFIKKHSITREITFLLIIISQTKLVKFFDSFN